MTTLDTRAPLAHRILIPLLALSCGAGAIAGPFLIDLQAVPWTLVALAWCILVALCAGTMSHLRARGGCDRQVWALLAVCVVLSLGYFRLFAAAAAHAPLSGVFGSLHHLAAGGLASVLYCLAFLVPASYLCLLLEELHHPRETSGV